jgi:hypothetical protein
MGKGTGCAPVKQIGGSMLKSKTVRRLFLIVQAAVALFALFANAAVPANYLGKTYPLGSAPKEIPGRINFHEYDKGGPGVSFVEDDMASGHWGGCTAGLRDTGIYADGDPDHPSFQHTNNPSFPDDTFYADGMKYPNGVRYPGPDTSKHDWYIGACHPNNWFNITVHVSKPGKYWISSIWAAMETDIHYQLFFIGTQYAATRDTIKTDTVRLAGHNSYTTWWKYADFASITLDSGVQIVKFYNESYHVNQDFLYFAADSGRFLTGTQQPVSKAPGKPQSNLSINRGTVGFALPQAGRARISVYDCCGRELQTVLDRYLLAGSHSVALNAKGLKKGVYFVRMEHGAVSSVAKFDQAR